MNYLIDIGSSTIKVYKRNDGKVSLIGAKTFDFRNGFDAEFGLSIANKTILFSHFTALSHQFSLTRSNTKLYATGIFRDFIHKQSFIEEFYTRTGLFFNIVSHDLEAFYLEKAWIGKLTKTDRMLVINIGGKTTELIFYNNSNIVERKMLSLGVGTMLEKYASINDEYCPIPLDKVVESVREKLPFVDETYEHAIYTGGELAYMQVAGYKLQVNTVFFDDNHPSMISFNDYYSHNQRVFSRLSMTELRKMMPDNPAWMNGARACSAIAQAICEHYHVKMIIPSNANLIDGVNIQELRNVVVCGSFNKHLAKISNLIGILRNKGIDVLSPLNTDVVGYERGFVLFVDDNVVNHCTWSVEALHLKAIESCDAVVVCNYNEYVGTKTALEIGYAYKCEKKIIFLEDNDIVGDFDIPSEISML